MADQTLAFNILARDNASRVFSKVGHESSGLESRFAKVGKGMLALGATAAGGLALGLGAATVAGATMGLKIAAGNEQARISFTTMLGSARKADKFLRQLQAFAAKTPFEFPELQTAASSLISAGFHAKQVIPIMTTLGDVTSGMGTGAEGVQRATVALQQMSAAGRITGEDLNQLRDAGIPVFDLLANATGKSKSEIAALAQAGKLGKGEMNDLFKALETGGGGLERFTGLMAKQSQSLTGLWSTFKDTLGQGMATAIQPLIPLIKDGLGGASKFLADSLPILVDKFRDFVGFVTGTLIPKVREMGSAFSDYVVPKIQGAVAFIQDRLIPALEDFKARVVPAFTGAVRSIGDSLADLKSSMSNGADSSEAFSDDTIISVRTMARVIPAELKIVSANVKILSEAFQLATINIRAEARFITGIMDNLADFVLKSFANLARGAAILADALGMDSLAGKLRGAATRVDDFRGRVLAALHSAASQTPAIGADIANGLAAGIRANGAVAVATAQGIANKVTAAMRTAAQTHSPSKVTIEIGKDIAAGLDVGLRAGADAVVKAAEALVGRLNAAIDKVKDLRAQRASLASSISGAFGARDLTSLGNEDDTPVTAASMAANLAAKVQAAKVFAANIAALAKGGLNKQALSELAQQGFDQGGAFAQALVDGGKTAITQINQLQTQLQTTANQTGSLVAGSMYDAGIKAADGIVRGLRDKRQDILDALGHIGKAMAKRIRDALDIHSPSAVFAEVGRFVGQGLIGGMESTQGDINRTVAGLVGSPSVTPAGMGAAGGVGTAGTINLTVNAPVGSSPRDIGAEVYQMLLAYRKGNGPLTALTT